MSDVRLPAARSALLPVPLGVADVQPSPDDILSASATDADLDADLAEGSAGATVPDDADVPRGPLPRLDALEAAAAALTTAVAELAAQQHALAERVGAAVRLAERREATIDRLAAENTALRDAEREGQFLPMFRDLVAFFDGLDGLAARYASAGETRVAGDVGTMRDLVADLLARYGVETYAPEPGDAVQPKAHRAVRTVPGTAEQHLTVSHVLRVGFRTETRVVRIPEVVAFRCDPACVPAPQAESAAALVAE